MKPNHAPAVMVFLVAFALQSAWVHALDRENAEFKPLPNYPRAAAVECVQGEVVARFTVSETHEPSNVEIVRSYPEGVFDQVVLDALDKWVVNAEPGSEIEEQFDFELDGCA